MGGRWQSPVASPAAFWGGVLVVQAPQVTTCTQAWLRGRRCLPAAGGNCFASSQARICLSRATVASSCWQRKCFRCLWSSLIAMFCHDRLFLQQTQWEICEEKAASSLRISSVTLDGTRAPHRLNQHPAGQKVPQKWKF